MTREEILQIAKPILFNTDMVRAILDDKKTATRRKAEFLRGKNPNWTGYVRDGLMLYNGTNEPCIKPPRYKVGDYLYVRETWHVFAAWSGSYMGCTIKYKAGGPDLNLNKIIKLPTEIWHPSIHMPKEAARIFLGVTDVRVERLKDITNIDAIKEGFDGVPCSCGGISHCTDCMGSGWVEPPIVDFMYTWDSTIPKKNLDKYGWEASPWVWVIEFERVEA